MRKYKSFYSKGSASPFYRNLAEDQKQLFRCNPADFDWDNAELGKLSEGLKLFGKDWDKIAQYIGTKNYG